MRVILLTGKGGVGKTSLSLATALGAAARGHRTFLLSTDPAHSLADAAGAKIGARPVRLAERLVAQEVAVLEELDRSWAAIQSWLRELLRDEVDELVADELLVFPGLEELISLRAVREVEATGEFDVCVVDCAPTGATLRMLRFPDALRIFMENFFDLERRGARLLRPLIERVRGARRLLPREEFFDAFERLYRDVEDVRRILLDGARTTARLVLNPARVVVEETRRSFAYLSLYGVATDAVIVNRRLPREASEGFFARWAEREREEMAEIEGAFPIPILHAPLFPHELVGLEPLRGLAAAVYEERDPAAVYTQARPIRLRKRGSRTLLEIDLPGASKEEVDVSVRGEDLFVRVRDAQRKIALPASVAGRGVSSARLSDGVLEVVFEP
ncbi:MAG TPA: ArsA family ATPase [Myxococcota bacterium]|jgi:arsenite-transporting ATPase|nr:ArsA family ATPase [Myxococcota bacterium]